MSSWKGKTRGGLLGYKIFIYVLNKLGLNAAYALLRVVSAYFVVSAPKATASIYRYFRQIWHYSRWRSLRSVFKNYYVFGQTLIDKIAIGSGAVRNFEYTTEGVEHLKTLKDTGGIIISAHLGNWEIAGLMLDRIDLTTNILIFEAEHEKIKQYLENVMSDRKVNIIPIKQDLSHIFKINMAIRNKEIVCMHGDRFTDGSRVAEKMFMGQNAYFPLGPFAIVSKLKVPYSFAYALRGKKRKYELSATPIQTDSGTAHEVLDDYVLNLEEKLKQYPLQWFNYYDFWSNDVRGAIIE
ncbi:Lysophospholipid acyltransferase [Fulvivirga imtechensis AK7]|uniref:Lysophospholipid acyltransferase n=1 Tax=Fulvivirga imtechensis AK7 TaxID=1237149 RepID=L8JVQ3_9BACT|nr:Lysophospholipid acyltransferase [Fulvivirga imtechensis]ELR71302.1 Lysophospholipid acyltransferase [Fulvivirga imtechensis AK7]